MLRVFSVFALLVASTALACPSGKYEVYQVALDANGTVTRSELRAFPRKWPRKSAEPRWKKVITDSVTLGLGDVVTLNAAPEMQDASVHVVVRRASFSREEKGVVSTTYAVKEIWTSSWGSQSKSEKRSLVTVTKDGSCESFKVLDR